MTPPLTPDEIRTRVSDARVARLATIERDGRPHLVPITYAMSGAAQGDVLFTLVDQKPKSTRDLKRLRNIERDPRVTVLVDRYDDDWTRLWWCRGEGIATVVLPHEEGFEVARDAVTEKYQQYLEEPPGGPAIRIEIAEWSGWAAEPDEHRSSGTRGPGGAAPGQ